MQNIMASRYIVAQQRRHGAIQGSGEIVSVLEGSATQQGKPVYRSYNQPDTLGCQHYKRRWAADTPNLSVVLTAGQAGLPFLQPARHTRLPALQKRMSC